jgi:pimeloyl-ACP methyl ester carboxylesterase
MSERSIECSWGQAFVKTHQGDDNKTPIIALHGWLDNHASFTSLSAHLDHTLYCIDLPGHGKSSHLEDGNWYHFIDYIEKCREVIQKLNLESYILLGHSMGAAISVILTALFPEDVKKVILIDGLGPLINDPKECPDILRKAILERERKRTKKQRPFDSVQQAAELRKSVGQMSLASATLLAQEQLTKSTKGYNWSYDSKLTSTSSLRMTRDQLLAFYEQFNCPSLLIEASEGILVDYPYEPYLEDRQNVQIVKLTGHHHLHMDSPKIVATAIKEFL